MDFEMTTLGGIQQNISFTPDEFISLKEAIFHTMVTFGHIIAIIAFCIGIYVGWSWCKYYQKKEEG
jgi:hypothetical protein